MPSTEALADESSFPKGLLKRGIMGLDLGEQLLHRGQPRPSSLISFASPVAHDIYLAFYSPGDPVRLLLLYYNFDRQLRFCRPHCFRNI